MKFLSRQEEILLLAILKLKENAYGVTIRELVSESTQKYWSIGAIYDILDRLERKKLVKPIVGEPTAERGGKSSWYTSKPTGARDSDHAPAMKETWRFEAGGFVRIYRSR